MLDFHRLSKGIEIDRLARILQGAGPPGTSPDTISAQVGSLYLNTSGAIHIKTASGSGADKWEEGATQEYINSVLAGLSWREPVEVIDRVSAILPVGVPTFPIVVDGQTITDGQRVLFSAISGGAGPNIYEYNQTIGAFNEDPNVETQGDVTFVKRGSYQNRVFYFTGLAWLTNDPIFKNTVIVQKDPGVNQFDSISAALAYVATQLPTSVVPWMVNVYPGTYLEPTLTVPSYTVLASIVPSGTIVVTNSPAQDVVVMQSNSGLRGFTLTGASNLNKRGLLIQDATSVIVNEVFFANNDTDIQVIGDTGPVQAVLNNILFSTSAVRNFGLRITATGGNSVQCSFSNAVMDDTTSQATVHAMDFTGTGVEAILANVVANGNPALFGTGVRVSDGASVASTGLVISDYSLGLSVPAGGAAPTLRMNVQILSDDLPNIDIEHTGTLGFISGAADHDEITVATGTSNLNLAFSGTDSTDPGDVGFAIVGSLLLGSEFENITDTTDLIQQASPTGTLSGGIITTTITPLQVSVSEGYGYLVDSITMRDKRVVWLTTLLLLNDNDENYIYVDNSGVVTFAPAPPNTVQTILLGRARTSGGNVVLLAEIPFVATQAATFLDNYLRSAIGSIFGTGCLTSENATPLKLNVTTGTYYYSKQTFHPSGGTPIVNFGRFYHTGGSPDSDISSFVSNTQYDNGTNRVALTAGFYTKHTIYLAGDGANEGYAFVYGQAEYATLVAAQTAPLPAPPSFLTLDINVPLAALIVQEGFPNIVQIIDIRPRLGFQAPSTSGVTVHGDLAGLLADDHPQYLLVTGTRAMTGNLDMGGNSVINVNLVDGVDVSAHGLRHNPGGADAATTAIAVTLTPSSINAEGTAASFSRSDHTHLVSGFQPLDSDLTALAAIATTGLYTITGTGTSTTRSLVQPASGLTITNGSGVAGNPTFALANDLLALENLAGTGIAVRTAADTWAQRSLVQPAAGITITNPAGVAGDPTFALANDLSALEGLGGTGFAVRSAADTWVQRTITGTATRITVTNGTGVAGDPTIDIAATYIGQTSITTLGTITTGVWNGTTIAIANGGTGQITALAAFNALSPLTTKGDILTHDTTNNIRLGVGTDGQMLTADSSTASGLKWASTVVTLNSISAATGSNSINNGDNAQVWNWSLTTAAKSAFKFSENAASTNGAGSQFILDVGTIAASTAAPLRVQAKAVDALRVDPNGNVVIASAALATNATDGFLYLDSCAGVPSGVPTSFTGRVAVVYDTTNDRLDVYNTAWKSFYANGLVDPGANGIVVRTAANTTTARTITGTANRISVTNGDGVAGNPTLDISATYVGQTSITTLGTITTGVWTGTTIAIANGGTGQTTAITAFNALSPLTTQGDLLYHDGTNNVRLAKNTTATRYLANTGTTNNPAWDQVNLANGVTGVLPFANITNGSGLSVFGVTGTAAATMASIVGTANQILRVNGAGTSLVFGSIDLSQAAAVGTSRLAFANLTQGTARSVLGVTGNATADVASIQGTADQVLVINSAGTALAFGQVNLASTNAVTGTLPLGNGGTGQTTGLLLNNIIAATGANTINNGVNAQVWNWDLTANTTAFKFSENVASTGGTGTQFLAYVATLAASTAKPFRVDALGNLALEVSALGQLGIGASALATDLVTISGTLQSSGAVSRTVDVTATVPAATTTAASGYRSGMSTVAAAFTLTNLRDFHAVDTTKGAGSAITNKFAFAVDDITSGVNNYGFYSAITRGTNKWAFYGSSTAASLFGGSVIVGTAALATNATDGFLYLPTSAGTPTGVPTTFTGTTAEEYDTTNDRLYVYNGAWRYVQLSTTGNVLSLYKENPSTPTTPTVAGTNAVAIGTGSSATATNSIAIGQGTNARLQGMEAFATGQFGTAGDAQKTEVMMRNSTTNATTTELFIDGAAIRHVLPNNSAYNFFVTLVARRTDATGGRAAYTFQGLIYRDANAASTALQGAVTKTVLAESNAAWDANVDADTTNGSLRIQVNGEAAKTIRWVAYVRAIEVTN